MKTKLLMVIFVIICILNGLVYSGVKSTASISSVDKGINLKLPASFGSQAVFAGTFRGTVDGNIAKFFCIDLLHHLSYNESYSDVKNTNKFMTYILNNYYPLKSLPYTGSLAEPREAAAIQCALWYFSDGVNVDSIANYDNDVSDVKTRAKNIINDALANGPNISPVKTLVIYVWPQIFHKGNPIKFRVEVYDELNRPVPNVTVTLNSSAGILSKNSVSTDSTGRSDTITITPGASTATANITANAVVKILQGTQYNHVADPNGKQKIIIATPVTANKSLVQTINWWDNADISIAKVASKTIVNNGDQISYTITVSNNGSSSAPNVQVLDLLPAELLFLSSSGTGNYNPSTGIWTIGALSGKSTASMTINTKVNLSAPVSFDLGIAKDFNLFVLGDMNSTGSDTRGKLAVKNDAYLHSYAVGDGLTPNSGNVLVVGRRLTYLSGKVSNGSAVYGQFIDTLHANLADGGIIQGSPIDFTAAANYLNNLSQQISSLPANGVVSEYYNQLFLSGTNPIINVFNVDGAKLASLTNFEISVPAGATAVINFSGKNIIWHNGFKINGTTKDKVFMNFYQAENIEFSYIGLQGVILAPLASLYYPSGLIDGQVIVKNMSGQGQFNWTQFTGNLLSSKSIVNNAQIMSLYDLIWSSVLPGSAAIVGYNLTVNNETKILPKEFRLEQNYPNPFNPSTRINYSVPEKSLVTIKIYNILGNVLETLLSKETDPGNYTIVWNPKNQSSGIYFIEMKAKNFKETRKMILSK